MKEQAHAGKHWWLWPTIALCLSFAGLMEMIRWVNEDRDVAVEVAQGALCFIWIFAAYQIAGWFDRRMKSRKDQLAKPGKSLE